MKIIKENKETLSWDMPGQGLFEATMCNGELIDLRFLKNGSNIAGYCLLVGSDVGNMDFLKCVYIALSEFFLHIGNKKEGG